MEFVKVVNINRRMCKYYQGNRSCDDCPLSIANNNSGLPCNKYTQEYPLIAEDLIIKWDKEHPQKTRLSDFKEKYPNAPMNNDNIPLVCSRDVGYLLECPSNKSYSKFTCTECWDQPIDE